MAEVKWIKITTNIFDDEKIKLIDTMPDRDTLLVIWFKLLAMAGKTNDNGLVYVIKEMPTTDEMLATIFNRPLNTVRLALKTFSTFGMIEINNHVNIVNWEKHQNVEGLDKIREQNRKRQAKLREKNKIIAIEDKNNVTSRDSNAIEEDIEIDKEKENNNTKHTLIDSVKLLLISENLKEKLIDYLEYRKEIKKPLKSLRSIKEVINKIGTEFSDEDDLAESISYSISKGWQGIFKDKTAKSKPAPYQKQDKEVKLMSEDIFNDLYETYKEYGFINFISEVQKKQFLKTCEVKGIDFR